METIEDIKAGFTQKLAGSKINGLLHYIQQENKKGKKLFGGIVTKLTREIIAGDGFILTRQARN